MRSCRLCLLGGMVACAMALAASDSPKSEKAPRRTHVRLAGVSVGAGYASGPFWYPYAYFPGAFGWWPYSFWDPWYASFYHPGYFTGFAQGPNMGEVKLQAEPKDAEVYLDGAYAGIAAKLKHIWLNPGAYNLEVKADGRAFSKRIYVLSGKTLNIDAELARQPAEATP